MKQSCWNKVEDQWYLYNDFIVRQLDFLYKVMSFVQAFQSKNLRKKSLQNEDDISYLNIL